MVQYSNLDRAMEARDHFKNEASLKNLIRGENVKEVDFKMKNVIVFLLLSIWLMSTLTVQCQVPYFSTTLSPYSNELNIVHIPFKIETYAELEGLPYAYIGTGMQGDTAFFWMMIDFYVELSNRAAADMPAEISKAIVASFAARKHFEYFPIDKEEALHIRRDTIRYKYNNENDMFVLEIIHHLSTGEVQHIWLDDNNNRSEKAVTMPIDQSLKIGKKFPDLTVEKLNGEKLSINDLVGKTVIINWWATHCGPCIAKMPGFNKLVEQYKENPDIVFIAISYDSKERVTRFLENKEFNYIQTLGSKDVLKIFGNAFPVDVIINSEGTISFHSRSGDTDKYLEIEKVINKSL